MLFGKKNVLTSYLVNTIKKLFFTDETEKHLKKNLMVSYIKMSNMLKKY